MASIASSSPPYTVSLLRLRLRQAVVVAARTHHKGGDNGAVLSCMSACLRLLGVQAVSCSGVSHRAGAALLGLLHCPLLDVLDHHASLARQVAQVDAQDAGLLAHNICTHTHTQRQHGSKGSSTTGNSRRGLLGGSGLARRRKNQSLKEPESRLNQAGLQGD